MISDRVLIFGESFNDTQAISHILKALKPDGLVVKPLKAPIVLSRDAADARRRKNRNRVAAVLKAEAIRGRVAAVVIHRDCDAVEPAHKHQCSNIIHDFTDLEATVIPVAPAFEIEAWWFFWPAAVASVNHRWKRLRCMQRNHGSIPNAKEHLIQQLRPSGRARTNEYSEADSPRIAEQVRRLGIVNERCGQAGSFDDFAEAVAKAL